MMPPMRFTAVGSAVAHESGNVSAVLESVDGLPLLWIDCGSIAMPACEQRDWGLPAAVFIAHTRIEHVGGLDKLIGSLACETVDLPSVCSYVSAPTVPSLHRRFAADLCKLAGGGGNF